MAESLTVRASGAVLVCNYEALEAGARRFIGRTFLPELGAAGAWPASAEPSKVPVTPEYLKSLRDGSLIAADEATAKLAGIKFDAKALAEAEEGAKEFWAAREKAEKDAAEKAKQDAQKKDPGRALDEPVHSEEG